MKTIGLVGGISWESSAEYYKKINQITQKYLGGHHSAKILLSSLDFASIEKLQQEKQWDSVAKILIEASQNLERAGAECILLAANTVHYLAEQIEQALSIPLLHIVDATALEIQKQKLKQVGLLGTRYTMEYGFYQKRLETFEISVLTPPKEARHQIHEIIYQELCHGHFKTSSKEKMTKIMEELLEQGAKGIILGCTELSLLICPESYAFPIWDTLEIHATAAVSFALNSKE